MYYKQINTQTVTTITAILLSLKNPLQFYW